MMKKALASVALAGALLLTVTPAAQAACYWIAPYKGDHVTYYNCRGPFNWNWHDRAWECYADWDWYAEVFWGKHDGRQVVVTGPVCYS